MSTPSRPGKTRRIQVHRERSVMEVASSIHRRYANRPAQFGGSNPVWPRSGQL